LSTIICHSDAIASPGNGDGRTPPRTKPQSGVDAWTSSESPMATPVRRHSGGNVSGCRSHASLECRGMYVSYGSRLTLAACGRCGRDYVTVNNRHTETLQGWQCLGMSVSHVPGVSRDVCFLPFTPDARCVRTLWAGLRHRR